MLCVAMLYAGACTAPETRISGYCVGGVCLFLTAIVWAVFGRTLGNDFINYDDPFYVTRNPNITAGLSIRGLVWAFTDVHAGNWHPLTTLSHALDRSLYGLRPAGHHLTNVVLHTATVLGLFLVLRRMTGALWRSSFVAAVFAVHPLRVESVAWVAERKDVLSGLFFVLTLAVYLGYVRRALVRSPKAKQALVGLLLATFALGLMCKPMLVTLPFVLLLLDYWPLGRLSQPEHPGRVRFRCQWPSRNCRCWRFQLFPAW